MPKRMFATLLGLFVLCAALVLALSVDAEAGGKAKSKAKAKAPKVNFQSIYSPLILELRAAKQLLDTANENYQGHRAKAEALVVKGMRILEDNPRHKKYGPELDKVLPPIRQPQPVSDWRMLTAHEIIKDVHAKLLTVKGDPDAVKAAAVLRDADIQIGLGLAHVKGNPPKKKK